MIMKSIFTLLLSASCLAAFAQLPFQPTSVVVYRVGDGGSSLSNRSAKVYLDEFSPLGILIQSIAMPTQAVGANAALTASGSSSSEGLITRSTDGHYLVFGGYNSDTGYVSISSSPSATIKRVIGRVDAVGGINTSTQLGVSSFDKNNIRGVVSTDGGNFWLSGSGSGIRYGAIGDTSIRISSGTIASNFRGIHIFDNQLYVSSTSGSTKGLFKVGTGLPVDSSNATLSLLSAIPTTGSPFQFFFADLSPTIPGVDVLYIADDGTSTGIQKFSFDGTYWQSNGALIPPVSGTRGLAGIVSGSTVALVTTTPTKLYSLIDASGYNQPMAGTTFTEMATAATNTAFRGVALAPVGLVTPLKMISFKAAMSADGTNLNWTSENEINVKNFSIERSKDGSSYSAIGIIAAQNKNEANYAFLDKAPLDGINYYRLKMSDNNGSFKYSNVITIVNRRSPKIELFPNPAANNITISHGKAVSGASITINTAGGQLVKTVTLETGAVQTKIAVDNLLRGHYIVTFNNSGEKTVTKFMKQ